MNKLRFLVSIAFLFVLSGNAISENCIVVNADTTKPKMKELRKEISIQKTSSKSIEVESDNGEISKLIIDGKLIPKEDYPKYQTELDGMKKNREKTISVNVDDDGETTIEETIENGKVERKIIRGKKGDDEEEMQITINVDDMDLPNDNSKIKKRIITKRISENGEILTIDTNGVEKNIIIKRFDRGHDVVDDRLPRDFDVRVLPPLEERLDRLHHYQFDVENNLGRGGRGMISRSLNNSIEAELMEDGYIEEGKNFRFELDGKNLRINGTKQPDNIRNKYKKLYEKLTSSEFNKESKLVIEKTASTTNN